MSSVCCPCKNGEKGDFLFSYSFAEKLKYLPERGVVWRELRTAAEIMHFSGDEVAGAACFCVKVCGKRLIVGIDGNHNAFILKSALKDDLLVGHQTNGVTAVAQRLGGFLCLRELGNPFGQFIGLRLVKA